MIILFLFFLWGFFDIACLCNIWKYSASMHSIPAILKKFTKKEVLNGVGAPYDSPIQDNF